jgi:putative aldouronate transport system substrate-binding protein
MRKSIRFILAGCLAVLLVPVLGAGGRKAGTGSAAPAGSSGAPITSLPLTRENVTFTVLASGGIVSEISSYDYNQNAFTKKVVDETGIKLEFIATTGADAMERRNIMLNTGTYPDIIMGGMSLDDLSYYAGQGIVIPLDNYNPLRYPNIKAAFDEFPTLRDVITGPDGKIYALPNLNECLHCVFQNGRVWYHMPWLRDKGIAKPGTTEEFAQMLRFIRDNDVNGNGNPRDEIPLAFNKLSLRNFISFIAQAYLPWVGSGDYGVARVNGRLVEQFRSNEFREALKFMAGLYKEGLIYPDSFNMSEEQLQSLVQAEPNILGILAVPWKNAFAVQPSPRWIDFFNLTPLKGPAGQQWGANSGAFSVMNAQFIITDKCKNPELAIALYNYLLDFNVAMDGYIGPKGIAWTNPDADGLGLDAKPAVYKLLTPLGSQPHNGSWNQNVLPMMRAARWFYIGNQSKGADMAQRWLATGDPSLRGSLLQNMDFAEEMWYYTALDHQKYAKPESMFIPPQALNDNDAARLSDINATLSPYKDQAFVEFITGVRNINSDTDWNTYLADLDRLNSKEVLTIRQKYLK